jgi:hypothetical protein
MQVFSVFFNNLLPYPSYRHIKQENLQAILRNPFIILINPDTLNTTTPAEAGLKTLNY